MRLKKGTGIVFVLLCATALSLSAVQTLPVRLADEQTLQQYAGVYQWNRESFLYIQLWDEFSGFGKPRQLVAFDESGLVRTLYVTDKPDQFSAGPGMAAAEPVESEIRFERAQNGKVASLTWTNRNRERRNARRADIEKHEDVRFTSRASVRLAGTLITPTQSGKHPAIILVHGSGAENREYMLPWARFLIRRGVAILTYDKRGVGESTGDWNTASFEDLADDVVAAVDYLKTRPDVDRTHIGLLGISQAGWIMPLASLHSKDIAFLISLSGAGVSPAETTLDQARNEMTMSGMPQPTVEDILNVLRLQYEFARTGNGWDEYAAARDRLAARMGKPPDTIPGTPDAPHFQFIKRLYFYDPVPTLRQLRTPTLAIWGELDNNIVAVKNKAAWDDSLRASGNRDYTATILAKANHSMWEANTGSNAEMKSLQRFVPAYFTTVEGWLASRLRGFQK